MMIQAVVAAMAMSVTRAPISAAPIHPSSTCRTVHGRMALWNGTPMVRIGVMGTHRVLGVGRAGDGLAQLPVSIRALWSGKNPDVDWNSMIYGDFRVCALAPMRPGRMQFVEVVDARRLVLRPRP